MAAIHPFERTELVKCVVCDCNCDQLCTQCKTIFCVKHLLVHLENCSEYKTIIRLILRDYVTGVENHFVEAFPIKMTNLKSPDESVRFGRNKMILVGRKLGGET